MFWVFSTGFWQESVVFAGLCNLREIHFSREGLKFFEIRFFASVHYYKY